MDVKFFDSYGNPVKAGDKIVIERHYCYPIFDGEVCKVSWSEKFGMYQWTITRKPDNLPDSFLTLSKFRKLEETTEEEEL